MKRTFVGLSCIAVLCSACPKEEKVSAGACQDCHQPEGQTGIEEPHPLFAVRCHECHGGDPDVDTVVGSHVANPTGDNIRTLPLERLLAEDVAAYRRFVNPSDLVATRQTCGANNAQAGSTGCHQGIVESSAMSIHATAAGLSNIPRFASGLRAADEFFAPVATTGASGGPEDAIAALFGISLPDIANVTVEQPAVLLEHTLAKGCTGCHLYVYGLVDYGSGRQGSTGCATCHMVYAEDARSQSTDPVITHDEKGHPQKHFLERYPPQRTCEACHFRSTRIGMQFKGIREETLSDRRFGLANAERTTEEDLHGKPTGFYIIDDDTRDTVDITPPDIHGARGMICADCHAGQDMHGTGHIRASMGFETGVECTDCHGTFEDDAGEDGVFMTTGGTVLKNMRREGEVVILTGRGDGRDRTVTQLRELKDRLNTEAIDAAHSDGNHGDLECYACHTAWMQNVYALRLSLDQRHESRDPLTGSESPGIVVEDNELMSLENLHLGINADGKIGPFMAYNILFDVVELCQPGADPECVNSPDEPIFGKRTLRRYAPDSADGKLGLTFTPVFPHTTATRSTVQPCERCHPRQWEVEPGRIGADDMRVRATYGQGTGAYTVTLSGSSTTDPVDLSRFADDRGQAVIGFSQPGVGPIPAARAMRPLSYRVPPTLR
jgi:hypothetical protein